MQLNQTWGKNLYCHIIAYGQFLFNPFPWLTAFKSYSDFWFIGYVRIRYIWEVEFGSYSYCKKARKRTPLKNWNIPWTSILFKKIASRRILFFISIKYQPKGRAYFSRMSSLKTLKYVLCPVKILITLARNVLLEKTYFFPQKIVNSKNVWLYMSFVLTIKLISHCIAW